jgi:hypothetical protein
MLGFGCRFWFGARSFGHVVKSSLLLRAVQPACSNLDATMAGLSSTVQPFARMPRIPPRTKPNEAAAGRDRR